VTEEQRADNSAGDEQQRVVVRDRRRIDPDTGQVRTVTEEVPADEAGDSSGGKHAAAESTVPNASAPPGTPGPSAAVAEPTAAGARAAGEEDALRAQLDERTADLKRLQAEYANYRKRVDRDRDVVIASAKAQVAGELLAILDDIERAQAHGDLTGAFKSVADKLVTSLQRAGLESFGHEGEPFDPSVHEAVQHGTSPDVSEPTVTAVLRRGYRFGDRMIRAALVAVTDHEPAPAEPVEVAGAVVDESETPVGWFESSGANEPTDKKI